MINLRAFGKLCGRKLWQRITRASFNQYWPAKLLAACRWSNFVAETADGTLQRFAEVDLRSHADACDPARPVGYLEGWYVAEEVRHIGIGRRLPSAAEDWVRGHGCVEMASDTWIDHDLSQTCHEALGFEVVDRCVHYRKAL